MSADAQPPEPNLLDTPAAGPQAIRGGVLRGAGYTLALGLSVVSVPLLIRHLGVAAFGSYVLVTSLMTLIAGVTEGGLQAVTTREYTLREAHERDALMRNVIGLRVVLTLVGVVVAVAFAVLAGYDRTLVLGTVLAGGALVVQSLQTLFAVPLLARLRFGWATAADLVRQAVLVSLTVTLILAGASLLPFFAIALPSALAGVVLTVWLVRGMTPFVPAFHRAEWWPLARDTVPYAAAIAVNVAYFRLAIVLMSLLTTRLETGFFAAAFRIMEVLLPVPSVVIGAVFPILARAARDDRQRLTYATGRILEVAVIAGSGLVLVLELAAPTIISVLAGSDSEPSVAVLRLQAPALLATFVAVAGGFSLLSLRRHRALLVANLAALASSVLLCIVLIPPYGARGAAVATTVAEVALAGVTFVVLIRALDTLRPSPRLIAVPALAVGIGVLLHLSHLPAPVQAIAGAVLYLAVLAAGGIVPPELRAAFSSWRSTRTIARYVGSRCMRRHTENSSRAAGLVCSPSGRVSLDRRRAVYRLWTSRNEPADWCRSRRTCPSAPISSRAWATTSPA